MKKRVLAALPLTAALLVSVPSSQAAVFRSVPSTQASVDVPEDCAVPPDIDLDQFNVVIGTNRSESLRGTAGPDFICGRLGSDVIKSFGDDDLVLSDTTTFFGNLEARGGHDVVFAGSGSDQVLPGPGSDTVYGGAGRDFMALAVGLDVGIGGGGADNIIGGFGTDVVRAGPGSDFVAGGPANDVLTGGSGDDFLAGEIPPGPPPPVPLPPPARNDLCIGSSGFDTAVDCDRLVSIEEEG